MMRTGSIRVLASCEIISEGLDVPSVRAVLLLRPTKSLGLFMQQVGRGMRPAPGKQELIVLDHVGNVERHGMPALERIWTLDGVEKAASTEEFEHTGGGPRKWDSSQGQLIELTQDRIAMIKRLPYRLIAASQWTEQELRIYAQHKGFKPGWVWHRLRDQWAAGGVP